MKYLLLLLIVAMNDPSPVRRIENMTTSQLDFLINFYKQLHKQPELSLMERETSRMLAEEMRKTGFDVTENFGGYGIVCTLKNGVGPTILYRTDLDGLPVLEKTNLEYASHFKMKDRDSLEIQTMHACGHDMHMTVWLGTARNLASSRDLWKGTAIFIGQPAEEIGEGAKLMLNAGLYEKFGVPDFGIGLHCSPEIPTGKVGFGKGFTMAKAESIDIKVYGRGAHGASPHKSVDPVVLASMMVMELQTIVSRNVDPVESAVVTVGSIKGGTKHNIIPDQVTLQLTVRTFKEEVRHMIHKRIREIARGTAIAAGLSEDLYPEVIIPEGVPLANFNDAHLVDRLSSSAVKILSEENIVETKPQMVAEDFAHYGQTEHKVPTVLFWLGTIPPDRAEAMEKGESIPVLHSPFYYPDPAPSIETGVKVTSQMLIDLFAGGE